MSIPEGYPFRSPAPALRAPTPASEASVTATAQSPQQASTPGAGRILLVEDNRDILRATQRILTTQRYDVTTAMDGEEALTLAREFHPDLILLDVMIPKIDGLEVCRRLKADPLTSGIMIIHVTGRGSVDNRVQGFDAGADDYIPKPFHIPELLARVRSALRIKRLTDDLAERNRLLVKSQKDLIQSEKMATIGLLASGIAHEFNNIMAGISGYAQLARQNPRFQETLVDVALTQTERALELTRSLSTYNRRTGDKTTCDAVKVIESALCLVVKEVESSGVRIIKEITESPQLEISPGQCQEVVLNLLLNAIQAIEGEGGVIRIRVGPADRPEAAAIEVIDNGQGIPEEHLGRIFDPFFTTKGALGGGRQPGTGLGLTVCYNIVQAAGGKVDVTSQVGRGTTFRVTVPRVPPSLESAPYTRHAELIPPAPTNRPLRILVVDDEERVRNLVRDYLQGHEVVCCSTGEAALEAYAIKPFDYVILDLCIHRSINGFQVFDRLSKFTPKPKVIFSSGRFPDPAYHAYLEQSHGHLLKPFKFESLASLLGLPPRTPSPGGNPGRKEETGRPVAELEAGLTMRP